MSAFKRKWDVPCFQCGDWPVIRLHPDGSIAVLEHSDCPNPPPESGEPPRGLRPGEEFPNKNRPDESSEERGEPDCLCDWKRVVASGWPAVVHSECPVHTEEA